MNSKTPLPAIDIPPYSQRRKLAGSTCLLSSRGLRRMLEGFYYRSSALRESPTVLGADVVAVTDRIDSAIMYCKKCVALAQEHRGASSESAVGSAEPAINQGNPSERLH